MRGRETDTGGRVGLAAAPRRSDVADIAIGMLVSGATTAAALFVLVVLAILALPGPPRPTLGP